MCVRVVYKLYSTDLPLGRITRLFEASLFFAPGGVKRLLSDCWVYHNYYGERNTGAV